MSLGAAEIAAVVKELAPLAGQRVHAVHLHAERALTLELRGRAAPATLLVSAEPDRTRLHVATERPPAPRTRLPFQAVLRRALEGARLRAIEALAGERVVAFRFERRERRTSLVAELTGRHGNVFLLDEAGVIRGSAGRNLSQRRALVPGRPYQPPAPRPAEASPPRRAATTLPLPAPLAGRRFPLSAAIEARYRVLEAERTLLEERRRLREPLRAAVARARRALEKLAEEAARVPAAEADRRAADLLKANLSSVQRGAREAALTDWTSEGPRVVRVALDPSLSPRQNMERYYRRYRRIAESAARVEARAGEVRLRLERALALLAEVERAAVEQMGRLERQARRLGAGPRRERASRRRREAATLPYRQFRSLADGAILVGRSAADNDALTLRVARGNDVWLHARGRPGAHVVLRLEKGRPPDGESLLDAAHLAAHFSEARGEAVVEVAWTRAKYVRKPRGATPGAVAISQERSIALRVEPVRLERLLASEETQAGSP